MELREAREIAAKAWCDSSTSHLDMIPELAEAFAKILVEEVGKASPASAPEGWKLVPFEPTPEMLTAGEQESENKSATYETVFAAMLAAVPTLAAWPDGTPRAFDNYEHDKRFAADSPTPPVSEDRWLPIETAPKDEFVLLAGPSGYTTIETVFSTGRMCSDYHVGRWIDHANDDLTDWGFEPTHWMPLPKAPAMQEDKKP